jgi:hypothetical protein
MIDSCISYKPMQLAFMLNHWTEDLTIKQRDVHQPLPAEIYEELLDINQTNGEKNTICFRYTTNSDIKASKQTKVKLKLIKFFNDYNSRLPYYFALFMFALLIPIFVNNPRLLFEMSSLFMIMGLWCVLWVLIMFVLCVCVIVFVNVLRSITPIKHPHYLYLSQIHFEGEPTDRLKLVFKDNENFYGKNNNIDLTIVINEGHFYNQEISQSELVRVLRTIQYAQLVQFVQ